MHHYGVRNTALKWFQDYLSQRLQYVTFNNFKSSRKVIRCGVPQGSILGPLLFLLYINDISTVSKACLNIMFADDTNMFISGKDTESLCNQLNADLTQVQEWLTCNKLSLNVKKTHYMIFTSRNKIVDDIDIRINNERIQRVYSTKFLGVQVDAKLSWKAHIEYVSLKLAKCAGILLKARQKLHKSSLISLYYSFAYPYLIYCNIVWGNSYPTNLQRIVIMQKKLIRIITCSPFRAHTEPLFFANKILNVKDVNLYMTSVFMYNCVNRNVPELFHCFCVPIGDSHDHLTRRTDDLRVPFSGLDVRIFSVRVNGPRTWNTLPLDIRKAQSLNSFKYMLRNYINTLK